VRVSNVHERAFDAGPERVGRLLDSLAGADDRLWPRQRWPAMRFDGALAVGRAGGHGPVRYRIEAYEPGARILFRFTAPAGFRGTHGFRVEPAAAGGARLRHELAMEAVGPARLTWPLFYRPLHDALLEDALDRASAELAGTAVTFRPFPARVRLLRRLALLGGRRRGPIRDACAAAAGARSSSRQQQNER
jgi:hypothetical protein